MNNLLSELNPPQKEAVTHGEGPLLILAGAGSGKTRVLTYRIAYLISEKLAGPENILGVTFTNKAAGEMKERVEKLVGIKSAGITLSTFHSFCARLLRQEGERLGFSRNYSIYDESDQQALINSLLEERNLSKQCFPAGLVANKISACKNILLDWKDYYNYAHDYFEKNIAELYQTYQTRLSESNAMDFDDLIMHSVNLFKSSPEVLERFQNRFRFLLVDEFQDTNIAQYTLVKLLAQKHKNLAVVGDDDQSIYGWRGADLKNILNFEKDFPECRVINLEQNYRSTGFILDTAWAVVKNNLARKEKKLWTDRSGGEKVRLLDNYDERYEAQSVVQKIKELDPQYSYSDFVILYRTNAKSRVLEQKLRDSGLPYVIVGGVRFYERKEVKEILAFLKLLLNPRDGVSLKRILKTFGEGIGEKSLSAVELYSNENRLTLLESISQKDLQDQQSAKAKKSLIKISGWLKEFQYASQTLGLDELTQLVLEKTGYLETLRLEGTEESLSRVENLNELVIATQEFKERNPGATLEIFLEEVALMTDIDQWDNTKEKISLMTLHAAKGLEFAVVFLVGLEEGLFPLSRALESVEETEEERRLFYVGCTRAKDLLFLSYAQSRTRYSQTANFNVKSRFIDEIPEELLQSERRQPDKWEQSGKSSDFKSDSFSMLKTGSRVIHPTFGYGQVLTKQGSGEGLKLTVVFKGGLKKQLLAKYAELEIVG